MSCGLGQDYRDWPHGLRLFIFCIKPDFTQSLHLGINTAARVCIVETLRIHACKEGKYLTLPKASTS